MAVRTTIAGMKNKRKVLVSEAHSTQGTTHGRERPFEEDALAAQIAANRSRATEGPAATPPKPGHNRRGTSLLGRKKAPSQMRVKRRGGPHNRSRLHGG